MERKFDIVHIRDYYPSYETPSSSAWIYDIVFNLSLSKFNPLVISPAPYFPKFLNRFSYGYRSTIISKKVSDYRGTNVIRPLYIKFPKDLLSGLTNYILSKIVLRTINKLGFKPILIHAHFGKNGCISLPLKKNLYAPLITSFYGYDVSMPSINVRKCYSKLSTIGDVFLALSEDMKKDLIILGFPEDKIIVHHLGIDLKKFKSSQRKISDKFIYLVVARLNEKKGIEDVLRAFSNLRHSNDLELRIVGDGPMKEKLVNLANVLKIDKYVKFINNFKSENSRKIVLDEMKNCDVFLLTSYLTKDNHKEGTPVVLMEAQACSKPCIATNHAGLPEVVLHGKTGIIVEERNIDEITEAMEYFRKNRDIVFEFGKAGQKHIENNFNIVKQNNKLIEIYNKVLTAY